MASVYILFSKSTDSFYTGFTTEDVSIRIQRHNEGYYEKKYTAKGTPWVLFLEISCASADQARNIELHIKRMKSRTYILNLKKYPEMISALIEKFKDF